MTQDISTKLINTHLPWLNPSSKEEGKKIEDLTDAAVKELLSNEKIPADLTEKDLEVLIELEQLKIRENLSRIANQLTTIPPLAQTLKALTQKELEYVTDGLNIESLLSFREVQQTVFKLQEKAQKKELLTSILKSLPQDVKLWDTDNGPIALEELEVLRDLDLVYGVSFSLQNYSSKTLDAISQLSQLEEIEIKSEKVVPLDAKEILNAIPQLNLLQVFVAGELVLSMEDGKTFELLEEIHF